jgi:hypothetical protein
MTSYMWPAVIGILASGAALATALVYGSYRWEANTRKLHKQLQADRIPLAGAVNFRKLDSLPPPVERYLRGVLKDQQPAVIAVCLELSGAFNMGEAGNKWKPFTSVQRVITQWPGFDWDARIMMLPGLAVRVHDAYIDREGLLDTALFGLVRLARIRGTGPIAQGELMRFLAEAVWYPTALLPCACLHWEAVNDHAAASVAKPDTILACYRKLIAYKFDGSKYRRYPGRPRIEPKLEALSIAEPKNLSKKERLEGNCASRWSAVGCTNSTTKKKRLDTSRPSHGSSASYAQRSGYSY